MFTKDQINQFEEFATDCANVTVNERGIKRAIDHAYMCMELFGDLADSCHGAEEDAYNNIRYFFMGLLSELHNLKDVEKDEVIKCGIEWEIKDLNYDLKKTDLTDRERTELLKKITDLIKRRK